MRTILLSLFTAVAIVAGLSGKARALSEPLSPGDFVQRTHDELATLIKKNSSDDELSKVLRLKVDFNDVVQRSLGNPCSKEVRKCTNRWDAMKPEQRKKVSDLLIQLIERNYQKNLRKTVNYEIKYGKVIATDDGTRVKTTASTKETDADKLGAAKREAPVSIDYLVKGTDATNYRIFDIYTEGSSLTKNWFQQLNADFVSAKSTDEAVNKIVNQLTKQLQK